MIADCMITIGLVNGMPTEARARTEQQFRSLFEAAARRPVALIRFALDPAEGARALDEVAETALDALVVTGMPPLAANLAEEPCFPRLAALADHAAARRLPTVWSCLAAHVAVLHLSGIARRRLPAKLTGLVTCTRTTDPHPLAAGLPASWRAPHSRHNDLPLPALRDAGYRVLALAESDQADLFAHPAAPFLFCQGHPEYQADTLLREYRRDVGTWLRTGQHAACPRGVFSAEAAAELDRFLAAPPEAGIAAFPFARCAAELDAPWQTVAQRLIGNFLDLAASGWTVPRAARAPALAHPALT